jgi:hypothetical protein
MNNNINIDNIIAGALNKNNWLLTKNVLFKDSYSYDKTNKMYISKSVY